MVLVLEALELLLLLLQDSRLLGRGCGGVWERVCACVWECVRRWGGRWGEGGGTGAVGGRAVVRGHLLSQLSALLDEGGTRQ